MDPLAHLKRFTDEQRKSLSDLFSTLSKLFLGGALVGPFLRQMDAGFIAIMFAVFAGVAFQVITHYILGIESEMTDDV